MSIIWADFPSGQQGIYGTDTTKMLNGIWAQVDSAGSAYTALVNDPDPNIGANGKVFYTDTNTPSSGNAKKGGRLALPSEATTIGLGVRLWMSNLPPLSNHMPFISFRNNSNGDILTLRVTTTGQLQAATATTEGNLGTVVATSTGPVLVANAYKHIEIKCTVGSSTGALEVRVDGVEIPSLTLSGQNFGTANIAQIFIGCADGAGGGSGFTQAYWKDLILWNTSGTVGNDFQGSVAVRDLYPDGDIALNWATSSGTTGWDLIDETTPNDADYIQAGDPAPSPYVATLTNLPEDVTSVRALLPIYRAVKTDGGDCNIQIGVTPNNIDWDDGANRPVTTAYTYWWDVSEVSPDTLAPWTPVEVNNAYVRANRTL